jgi:hypothetical protein
MVAGTVLCFSRRAGCYGTGLVLSDIGRPVFKPRNIGTGLYIKTLTQGIFDSPKIDPTVKERLKQEAKEKGEDFLYQRLRNVDPKTASQINPCDLFRATRALEVFDFNRNPYLFFPGAASFWRETLSHFKDWPGDEPGGALLSY